MVREEVGSARWFWVACEARCQYQLRRMKTWRAGRLAIASCPAVAEALMAMPYTPTKGRHFWPSGNLCTELSDAHRSGVMLRIMLMQVHIMPESHL